MKWLIWSHEHGRWWRANMKGYTRLRSEAGRYGFTEAMTIVEAANDALEPGDDPRETMCPDW
jgi:hypothetical protein